MITKDMTIIKIIKEHQEKIEVLEELGLYCVGCLSAKYETVEQAACAHGLDIEQLIYELNN